MNPVDIQTFLDDIAEYISETNVNRIKIIAQAKGLPEDRDNAFMTVEFQSFLYDLLSDCYRNGILVYLRIVWEFNLISNFHSYRIRVLKFKITRYNDEIF